MAEYIEREDAIRKAKMANHDTNCGCVDWEQDERTELYINEIPAADVAPVVHARWSMLSYDEAVCTHCGYDRFTPFESTSEAKEHWSELPKFCEGCGAKMEVDNG